MLSKILILLVAFFSFQIFAQEPQSKATVGPTVKASMCPPPPYPSASKRLEEEGKVLLKFLVGIDGKVIEADIEKSSGFRRLDEAAKAILPMCQFNPATKDGIPQESWASMSFSFKLEEGAMSIKPSVYVVSDFYNSMLLKDKKFPKMKFSEFSKASFINMNCRLGTTPIFYTSDFQPVEKFIQNAFNAELKNAGIYSPDGIEVFGEIKNIEISTYFSGYWKIDLELKLPNKGTVNLTHKFDFPHATKASISCPAAAVAFPSAVQQLIYKGLSDKGFNELLSKAIQ
jgi:TonB family protein